MFLNFQNCECHASPVSVVMQLHVHVVFDRGREHCPSGLPVESETGHYGVEGSG